MTEWDAGSSSPKTKRSKDPVTALSRWVQARSPREKGILGVLAGVSLLVLLWLVIEDHDKLFVMAEFCHFLGIGVLAFKLLTKKTCAGLSMHTQFLTALFLGVRLYCSWMMEYDIHTLLDLLSFGATVWVLGQSLTKLRHTWQQEADSIKSWYVIVPCMIVAAIAHPNTSHWMLHRLLWAFCVYLEAVSVLPQLRMMQNNQVVERFTAHYVFALGLSRFLSCAHWVLQLLDGDSYLFQALSQGVWPVMVLVSEIVQTFILADFCFYYVKAYTHGSGVVHLPAHSSAFQV